jgi:hypothetical protein
MIVTSSTLKYTKQTELNNIHAFSLASKMVVVLSLCSWKGAVARSRAHMGDRA